MKNKQVHIFLCATIAFISVCADGQTSQSLNVNGSIQSDMLWPQTDEKIGAEEYDGGRTNTYAEVNLTSKYIDAGARLEYMQYPMPGFEKDFAGGGVPFAYIKGRLKNIDLTLGSFYEQFGSGFIFRTYEERSLGIDNSLVGARLAYKPITGISFKVLGGKQRNYWKLNKSWLAGADLELSLDEWINPLKKSNTYLTLGGSMILKNEEDEDIFVDATHLLNLPRNVWAYDLRIRLQTGGWNILAEYASKSQDPEANNGYIYRKGYVTMLSGSYSQKGLSVLLQAKRSDNMTFRSKRSLTNGTVSGASFTSSYINHLPAFTMEHTYTLAAHYPYATQPDGEWAYQAEIGYNFKKHSALGGEYGTKVKLALSYVNSIEKTPKTINGRTMGSDGYSSPFWAWGDEKYYQDINVQIEKRVTKSFKLNLMYMNQFYNKAVIEQEGGMIHCDIAVIEGKYRINNKFTLRAELQYLATKDDDKDWLFALMELSFLPNWMFTLSDEYNCGVTNTHYYNAYITWSLRSHRLQVGYIRTRAGYNCSGGVCRYIPACRGISLSYNYNF